MKITKDNVEPGQGKYFVCLTPLPETTDSGIHIPKMTGPDGRPMPSSMPPTATGTIVRCGGALGGTTPQWHVGDTVILSVVPPAMELEDGKEYCFIDFYHAIAKVTV